MNGDSIKLRMMLACGLVLLAGCEVSPPTPPQQGVKQGSEQEAAEKMESGKQAELVSATASKDTNAQASPLDGLMTVFLSTPHVGWQAFDAIPGIRWRDAAPQENPDTSSLADARYRSGELVLSGFGQVQVPDGQQGADAGVKDDNEGKSGLTLAGDREYVLTAALQKFYASEDYQAVLQRQFGGDAQLKVIAETCGGDDPAEADPFNTRFYEVALKSGVAYVEAYSDEGEESHGPGSTTFVFTKAKPKQRIASLGCKENISK
jgi:hypothetical protein